MFGRLLGRGKKAEDGEESTATKAHMGESNKMYYCKEKKKWRIRGEEHLEKEDEALAPPPVAKAKPAEPAEEKKDDSKAGDTADAGPPPPGGGPPKAAGGGVDSLIAPPNPYGGRIGGRGRGGPKAAAAKPPGMMAGSGFGGAPTTQANPFAPKKFQGTEGGGDAAPAASANPFAPKAFQAKNPNAPKKFQAAQGPFGQKTSNGEKYPSEPGPEPGASEAEDVAKDDSTSKAEPDAAPVAAADKEDSSDTKEVTKVEPAVAGAPVFPPPLPSDDAPAAGDPVEPPSLPVVPPTLPVVPPTVPDVGDTVPSDVSKTFPSGQPEPETPGAPNFVVTSSDLAGDKEDDMVGTPMPEVPSLPEEPKEAPDVNGTSTSSWEVVTEEKRESEVEALRESPAPPAAVNAAELKEKEEELRSLREANRSLQSQLQVVNSEMKAFKDEYDSNMVRTGKAHQDELAEMRRTLEADRTQMQASEAQMKEELQKARGQQPDAAYFQSQLEDLQIKLQTSEETRKAVEDAKQELEHQLAQAQQAIVVSKSAPPQEHPFQPLSSRLTHPRNLAQDDEDGGGEEFELPDFVWSCGDDKVMQFVQKLIAENASLRRQVDAAQSKPAEVPSLTEGSNRLAAELFDTKECNVERMLAFLHGLGDGDSHQIQPLLSGLVEYQSNADVCTKACQALETLTFTQTQNRREIAKHNGFEAIMGAVDRHQDHDGLLRAALGAVWNLTFDDEVVDEVAKANAVERTVQVMQRHLSNADLQGSGCAILLNLAVKEQNRAKIVDAGGIRRMVEAMESHPNSEEVLEQGCQALYMLAYHQDLKPLVLEARGAEATKIAARCRSSRVQKWGQWLEEVLTS